MRFAPKSPTLPPRHRVCVMGLLPRLAPKCSATRGISIKGRVIADRLIAPLKRFATQ
jgi:hypothetical protein